MAQTKAQLVVGLNVNASAPASALQIDASGNVNLDSNTLYVDATNNRVGVGTTSPSYLLHLAASEPVLNIASSATTGDGAQLRFVQNNGRVGRLYLTAEGGPGAGAMTLENPDGRDIIFKHTSNERLRIDSSGRVGIGTSSPGGNLTVTDASTYTLNVNANAGGAGALLSTVGGSASLALGTNSTERVRITAAGNVGIGTTSPDNKLHIFAGDSSGSSHASAQLTIENSGNSALQFLAGTSSSSEIRFGDSGDNGAGSIAYVHSDNSLRFGTNNGTEKARIDSSGRLLVGTSSSRSNWFNTTGADPLVQLETSTNARLSITRNDYSDNAGELLLGNSRSTGYAGLLNNDSLGRISFQGADGSEMVAGAYIQCFVDGTPGADDMPGRLTFSTTLDGNSSPSERVRITNKGFLKATNIGAYVNDDEHEFINGYNNKPVLRLQSNAGNGTQYGLLIRTINDQNDATRHFFQCLGDATERATIRSNGGLANYSANNVNLSDINTKKDIAPVADTWDCIKEWEIVNYRYKDQPDDAELNLGVIAQQVAESCPEVITVFEEAKGDQPEKLGIKEQQMYWMAIKALQEAQVRIEALEAEVAALKTQ